MRPPRRRRGEASRGVLPAETDAGDAAATSEAFSSSRAPAKPRFFGGSRFCTEAFAARRAASARLRMRAESRGVRAPRAGDATTIAVVAAVSADERRRRRGGGGAALALAGFFRFSPFFFARGAGAGAAEGLGARAAEGLGARAVFAPGAAAAPAASRAAPPFSRALYAAFASASAANVPNVTVRRVVGS